MNLLKDKRDDERQAETTVFKPVSSEDFGADIKSESKRVTYSTAEKSTAKRFPSLLFVAALLILAMVILYFGFFKNREVTTVADAEPPVILSDTTKDTTAVLPASAAETETVKTAVSADTGDQTDSATLLLAADLMQVIQNTLAPGRRVTAFFLDEGSFSAEIETGSLEDAKSLYATIQQSLPATTKLTSSAPVIGATTLLSGIFTPTVTAGNGLTRDEIEQRLKETARTTNMSVVSLSIEGSAKEQKFVFMKIEGSFENSRLFVEKLAQSHMRVSVSKLILMPASDQRYTFVLRFYV